MSQVSIIIPTRDRPHYLARVLDYYRHSGHTVIVSDGSAAPYPGAIPGNTRYLHLAGVEFELRIRRALEQVSGHYCVLCADDDFVVNDALRACSRFLDERPDCAAVHGQYFAYFNGRPQSIQPIYDWGAGSSSHESAWKRALEYFANYVPAFYALHRSEAMKSTFCGELALRTVPYANVLELYQCAVTILSGGIARLPVFYSLRELAREAPSGQYISIRDFWTQREHEAPREWFRAALNSRLAGAPAPVTGRSGDFAADAVIEPYLREFVPTYERRFAFLGKARMFLQSIRDRRAAQLLLKTPEFREITAVIERHPEAR
jgi:glycosyltransferase domain-containing protein